MKLSLAKSTFIAKILGVVFLALFFGAVVVSAQEVKLVYKIHVDGLSCPFCTYGIEKRFSKVKGMEGMDIELKTGAIVITMAAGTTLDEMTARKTVEAAGFTLRDFKQVQEGAKEKSGE